MSLLMSLGGFFSKFLELLTQTGSPLMFYNGLFWFLMIVFIPVYAALKSRRKQMMLFVTAFSLFLAWKASGLVSGKEDLQRAIKGQKEVLCRCFYSGLSGAPDSL